MDTDDTQIVERVQATLDDLHKLTAAARLYGLEHPRTEEVAEALAAHLHPVMRALGELELRVARNGLLWHGHEVYADDDERDGLARTLHREGVVRLTLLPGLVRDEIVAFAGILGTNLNLPRWEEETLTSLLWQAKLEHIAYEAVEYLSDAQEMSETAAVGEETYVQEILRMILQPDPPEAGKGVGGFGAMPARAPQGSAAEDDGFELDGDVGGAAGQREEADDARSRMAVPDPTWTPAQHIAALDLSQWAEMPDGELDKDIDLDPYQREAEVDTELSLLRRVSEILVIGGSQGRSELEPELAMSLVDRVLARDESGGPRLWPHAVNLADRVLTSELPLLEPGREPLEGWLDSCTNPGLFAAFADQMSGEEPAHVDLLRRFLRGRDGARSA